MNKSTAENFLSRRPVALIGMPGAGKTSVGRALARLLSIPFYDADREIEAAAGCTIARIFADYGESEFRRLERQVIARLLDEGQCVLSLGGGAFMNEETRARLRENACSVWLRVDRALLLARVSRNNKRPLLQGDPEAKLDVLLDAREPVYAMADVTVQCDDRPVTHTARQVKQALHHFLSL